MSEVKPPTHLPDSQSVHLYSHVPPRTMEHRPSPLIIAEAVTLSQLQRPDNRHWGCDRPTLLLEERACVVGLCVFETGKPTDGGDVVVGTLSG